MSVSLSPLAEIVRKNDRDRFVTTLFAPEAARDGLFALYALNVELAHIRTQVREPHAGLIRLQWWREVLEGGRDGEARPHPVAWAARGLDLAPGAAEPILLAREKDLEPQPFASLQEIEDYAQGTAGCLARLACGILETDGTAAQKVGTAFALVGLVRALPFHRGTGWSCLPAGADVAEMTRSICSRAAQLLGEARDLRPERAALPVTLAGTQTRRYLKVLESVGYDPFDSRVSRPHPIPLRLVLHSWLGRF